MCATKPGYKACEAACLLQKHGCCTAGCQALKCRDLYRLLQLGWVFFGIYLVHVMTMPCCCAEAITFILQQDFVQQGFYSLCLLYGTAV